MPGFSSRQHSRCQRGLHWVYTLPGGSDLEGLGALLQSRWPLVASEERWGSRRVWRLVYQFRFEIRLGTRDDELSFIHRACTPEELRRTQRAQFEALLHDWITHRGPEQ